MCVLRSMTERPFLRCMAPMAIAFLPMKRGLARLSLRARIICILWRCSNWPYKCITQHIKPAFLWEAGFNMSSKKNSVEISEGWSRSLGPAFCMEKQTLGQRDIHALPKPVRLLMLCAIHKRKRLCSYGQSYLSALRYRKTCFWNFDPPKGSFKSWHVTLWRTCPQISPTILAGYSEFCQIIFIYKGLTARD